MASGKLYSLVTRYWPRIAAGLVVALGILELVLGGLTADSSLELYLTAWAATTGGLWWLFEKAEKALSNEAREQMVAWVSDADIRRSLTSIPRQFVLLFDRVFGERHLSLRCLASSALASVASVLIVFSTWLALFWPLESLAFAPGEGVFSALRTDIDLGSVLGSGMDAALVFALLINVVPDYISLLETRFILGWLKRDRRLARGLLADLSITGLLSGIAVVVVSAVTLPQALTPSSVGEMALLDPSFGIPEAMEATQSSSRATPDTTRAEVRLLMARGSEALSRCEERGYPDCGSMTAFYSDGFSFRPLPSFPGGVWNETGSQGRIPLPLGIFFYSAFFTSTWLWIYAASVPVTRLLLRMNSGVGFLLRVTDVERQPFRSLGFVSVVLVSLLFMLGLPLVIL